MSGSASVQSIKTSLLVQFRNHEGSPPLFRSFFVPWYNVLKYPYVVSYRVSFCTSCFFIEFFPLPYLCLLSVPSTQVVQFLLTSNRIPCVVSYRVSFCTSCFFIEFFPLPYLCLLSVPSTQVVQFLLTSNRIPCVDLWLCFFPSYSGQKKVKGKDFSCPVNIMCG